MPPGVFVKDDVYVRRRWRQIQYITDLFWRRWTQEYLPLLQEWQKWLGLKRSFKVGDVVLVADPSLARNSWMLGRTTKQVEQEPEGEEPGRDGRSPWDNPDGGPVGRDVGDGYSR
ncbi:hypothetical protein ACEWY4_020574 [Coilia grayii]|uniref:DUF5641 domain-containing protein n=1 Tax=Coilia grayii TaxID=363190 RepID=A0ABD1JG45_9TELE